VETLQRYIKDKRIVVCCGAGGVGKTTVSASLALAAARLGRRVLVLTIDPSRRLAQTLGISRNRPEPTQLSEDNLARCDIHPPGKLSAWVLDPSLVADRVIRNLARTPDEAQRLLSNRIYLAATRMIAGMQEYTAVEALHGLLETGQYDLVVLDTPPSNNALSFLDAPVRLARFLDGRIFKLFVPHKDGFFTGAARKLIYRVLSTVLGEQSHADFTTFLSAFGSIFRILSGSAKDMKAQLQAKDVTFLLVTSSATAAVTDAMYFRNRLRSLELPCGGFVLNRTNIMDWGLPMPEPHAASVTDADLRTALEKLLPLAQAEKDGAQRQMALLDELKTEAGEGSTAAALPEFPGGVDDLEGLCSLVNWILNEQAPEDGPTEEDI
jgi:anion-transporting  ArsA/GET3 family ATPase